jgi:hypothetical protein
MSVSASNIIGAFSPPSQLTRIAPEPQSNLGTVFGGFSSIASSLMGSTAEALVGADYSALIGAQLQAQKEMQVVSMVSNVEKSKHETQMAAIRNIRVG